MTTQAALTARLTRITERLVTDATKGERPVGKRKHRQLKRRFDAALAELTLESYLDWCNRSDEPGDFKLAGADHWRSRGVHTAAHLGRILDAEARRSMEKDSRYGGDDFEH